MPWTTVNGKDEFIKPPYPLKLPPGMEAGSEEANDFVHARQHLFWPWWKRVMAEWFEFHRGCPRKACRRAGNCASPTVACYEAAEPLLKKHVYPQMNRLLREVDGPGG